MLLDALCEILRKNLGATRCSDLPELPKLVFTTPMDFSLSLDDLESTATLKAALQAAMIAGVDVRIYKWPKFSAYEANNEDAVYEENALGDMFVRNGKNRFRGFIRRNLCQHKAMFTHRSNEGRVFVVDINNKMLATFDEESELVYGLSYELLNPEKLMISDGTVATKSPIYFVLADSNEIDERGVLIPVPFVNTLKPLTDVKLAQPAIPVSTSSLLTISVKTSCDGIPVVGLLQADFLITTALGVPIVLDDFTDNGDGTYTFESTADFVDGSLVKLRAANLLTVKAYEGENTVVVNV